MSKEFIEKEYGRQSLDVAKRQYKQLSHFISSKVQSDVREGYYRDYIERKYYNDNVFLNHIKNIFKDVNFLAFSKYYREPNPSASLINTRIKEPLSRVFFSEDSYFRYVINGRYEDFPEILNDDFNERLFDAVIERYNDIIVHDLFDVNKPYREFVSIDKVVSIKVKHGEIVKIAYLAKVELEDEDVFGYAYIDDKNYQFYSVDKVLLKSEPHDFGKCPATFVVKKCFGSDEIVKESIFSYLRAELEEYAFLKTLQRMTDANGTLPIAVQLDTNVENQDNQDFDNNGIEPMSINQINGQVSKEAKGSVGNGTGSDLQAGTIIKVPIVQKEDGSVDMEIAKNFITFHYTPVEALKNLNDRINKLEKGIIISSLGDFSEGGGEASMTELQVSKGYVSKEDKLRWISNTLSHSRQLSDYVMLSLAYGKENVKADVFYGSDFFMENQEKLYQLFKNAPNVIEKKNILIRLAQRRNMFNKEKSKREVILYKILPYSDNEDFRYAVENQLVDDVTFMFQNKFSYWVSLFEATYGNIVNFWDSSNAKESEKIIEITNLITELINSNTNYKTITDGKETNS